MHQVTKSDPFASDSTKSAADSTRECKQLLKTMILGVKTVVWSVPYLILNERLPARGQLPE